MRGWLLSSGMEVPRARFSVGSPGLGRRKASHARRELMPRRVRWVLPTCCVHLCAEAGAGAQRRLVRSPSLPVPEGLSGPKEPSPLFQRLPFQPRSKVEPRRALPRGVRRAGACLGAAPPTRSFHKNVNKTKKGSVYAIPASVKAKRPNPLSGAGL